MSTTTRTRKNVRFHSTAKQWDGLVAINETFDKLIGRGFNATKQQSIQGIDDVLAIIGTDIHIIQTIYDMIGDVIKRVRCSSTLIGLLPRGGGNNFKLGRQHLPWMLWVQSILRIKIRNR
jgi:hypothetical protein